MRCPPLAPWPRHGTRRARAALDTSTTVLRAIAQLGQTSPAKPNTRAPTLDLSPITDAGKFLAAFSPLQQALREPAEPPSSQVTPVGAKQQSQLTPQGWLDLAARHEAAGRRSEAINAFQTAARLAPESAIAHYNLGLAYSKVGRTEEAVASLRRAISLQPEFGRAHFRLGLAFQDLGQEEDAIAAFRAAIALRSNVRRAHSNLGDLLLSRGEVDAATASYRQAADDSTWGRLNLARALLAEERTDEAAATLRRALALDPTHGEAEWMLGNALVLTGRFDEAMPHLDRAIALAPEAVGAFNSLAYAKRFTEDDRPVVARMTRVLNSAPLSDVARMKLEYSLGKVLDDLRDYADAIRHFDAANRIDKAGSHFDRAQLAAWVDLLIARCTPNYFAQHAALGADDEMPLLVVGMPRSGTTLVEQIVSSHPLVAGGGELEFWLQRGPDWENSGPEADAAAINRLAEDYRAELRRLGPGAVRVIDKMPHNFLWVGLIHLVFPRAASSIAGVTRSNVLCPSTSRSFRGT